MVKQVISNLWLVLNMGICAVLFLPWALPRETISGFVGRKYIELKSPLAVAAVLRVMYAIDRIYFWETLHCLTTYMEERNARLALYPHLNGR